MYNSRVFFWNIYYDTRKWEEKNMWLLKAVASNFLGKIFGNVYEALKGGHQEQTPRRGGGEGKGREGGKGLRSGEEERAAGEFGHK